MQNIVLLQFKIKKYKYYIFEILKYSNMDNWYSITYHTFYVVCCVDI